jgi:tetratricopeptide (TPR) repeat protein
MNGTQILAFYQKLKAEQPQEYGFDSESTLNEIGYELMGRNIDASIAVFEYNTVLFPQSGNVFDSLGEAYYKKGDKQKALANYQKSLQLNPSNGNAKKIISELEK